MTDDESLVTWGSGAAPSSARRRDDVVLRDPGPWSATVLDLLRHLERGGVTGCPRVVGSGFAPDGRETVSFVEGTTAHPGAWPHDDDLFAIGALLRQVHDAGADFVAPAARWRGWYGRALRSDLRVIGHCDTGPWNVLRTGEGAFALIDWEFAGPTDAITDVAQATWLNARLHDDDIAREHGLPAATDRAVAARAFADGYPVQWAVAWRARSAAWMVRNRRTLANALA